MNPSNSPVIATFSSRGAARIAGLTPAMVNYLCRYDIVSPQGGVKRGRGTSRQYTYTDVLLLRVISKLLLQGISVLRLRKSLVALQRRGRQTSELVARRFVATDGRKIYFEDKGVLEMLDSGQMSFAFVLELEGIRKELASKIVIERKVSGKRR